VCYHLAVRKVIILLILSASFTSLSAQHDWSGLWRISRYFEDQVEEVVNLFIQPRGDGVEVTVYPDQARPMAIQSMEFRAQDNFLEVRAANDEKRPLPMLFKFSKEGDRISGNWVFSHMQFGSTIEGRLEGFRVFPEPYWEPWLDVEVRRPERLLDLAALLVEQGLGDDFDEFQALWDELIERNYYFPLQNWIYGRGGDPIARKRKLLEGIFQQLKDESALGRLRAGAESAKRVIERLKLSSGSADPERFLIILPGVPADFEELLWSRIPTREEEVSCRCSLDLRERFIFFDPLQYSETGVGPVLSMKDTLRRALWTNPAQRLPIRVFREALALGVAIEDQGAEWNISTPNLEAARIEFGPLLSEQKSFVDPKTEDDLAASLVHTLGLSFIRDLRQERTLQELIRLSVPQILSEWKSFLAGG